MLSDDEIQAAGKKVACVGMTTCNCGSFLQIDMKGEFMWNVAWELIPEDAPVGSGDLGFLDDESIA